MKSKFVKNQKAKLCIVTGGMKRIGKKITEYFIQRKWDMIAHYNSSKIESDLFKQKYQNSKCSIVEADFRNIDGYITLKNEIKKKINEMTSVSLESHKNCEILLLNNASMFINDNMSNIEHSKLSDNFNVNVCTPIMLVKAIMEVLKAKNDEKINFSVINLLDNMIENNPENFFSYSLTKKYLRIITESTAIQIGKYGRSNAIALGNIIRNQNQSIANFKKDREKAICKNAGSINDLIKTITFLLQTKCVTGQVIFLDGGARYSKVNH